jgi:quercetin dioxygenase-like cupin family protein
MPHGADNALSERRAWHAATHGLTVAEDIMSKKLSTGDLIDMMGARFEMVARMGPNENDTVLFRTRMEPGKLVPLHSHIDPECFYLLEGQIDVFVVDDAPKWRMVETGQSALVANGVKHAVRNAGEKTADIVLATNNRFFSPRGGPLRDAGRRFHASDIRRYPAFDAGLPSLRILERIAG